MNERVNERRGVGNEGNEEAKFTERILTRKKKEEEKNRRRRRRRRKNNIIL